jgi:hypothetical protein
MNSFESNFDRLQKSFGHAMLVNVLTATALVPLLALGVAGLTFFLAVWDKLTLALAWSVLISGIAGAAVGTALLSQSLRQTVLTRLLGSLFQVSNLRSDRSRHDTWSALESFSRLATASGWGTRLSSADPGQSRMIGNLYDLLGLQVEAELTGALPNEDRGKLADEVKRLLQSAKGLVSDSAAGPMISRPKRIRELLERSEIVLADVLAVWPAHRPGNVAPGASSDVDDSAADFPANELEPALLQRRHSLKASFDEVAFPAGKEALDRLDSQYGRLLAILARRREGDLLLAAEIPVLAEEAYNQALSVLEDAVDMVQATNIPDRQRLEREANELEAELADLASRGDAEDRVALRSERLQLRRQRLRVMEKQELSIEQLLNECERCETSLDRTCIELASIKGESAAIAVTAVTETLRRTVERARSVQDELKHLV